jgi:hypothetical protein
MTLKNALLSVPAIAAQYAATHTSDGRPRTVEQLRYKRDVALQALIKARRQRKARAAIQAQVKVLIEALRVESK